MKLPIASAIVLIALTGMSTLAQQGPGPGFPPQGGGRRGGFGRGGPGRGGGGPDTFGLMRVPEANPLTPDKIARGRQLFFDVRLSADDTISCATCHDPQRAFTDGRDTARGIHAAHGDRNTPSLVNAGFGRSFFWDGRADTLEQQVLGPIANSREMGLSTAALEAKLGMTSAAVADALASYVRTIRSRDSRFDWYQAGQTQMLTPLEQSGFELFRGRGQCVTCHAGPAFTDDRFHNTGIGWVNGRFADEGRFVVSNDPRDRGAFKTPTLREIALTAPYMHDGSLPTLEAVIDFYSEGGRQNPALDPRMRPRDFSPDDKRALAAFLRALSGRITEGS